MGSLTTSTHLFSSSSSSWMILSPSSQSFLKPSKCPLSTLVHNLKITERAPPLKAANHNLLRFYHITKIRATLDEKDFQNSTTDPSLLFQQTKQPNKEVEESVKLLKIAAKTRRVAAEEVLSALSVIEKAKLDPSGFLETLGGSKSPGKTWMLVFTAQNQLKGGRYVPITAVQRFDATAKRIENGVYLGPIGFLTFEGRFSWKNRILAFIFECIRIKIGVFNPFEINFGGKDAKEPSTKDPFFIWFYIDEEIAVARGRSGGTAFWCRCHRVFSR